MRVIAILVALAACATPAILTPPTGFPCGYHGHGCGNGYCCDDTDVCGMPGEGVDGAAFSGCAPGYCCFVGDPTLGVSLTPKRQYAESR